MIDSLLFFGIVRVNPLIKAPAGFIQTDQKKDYSFFDLAQNFSLT